MSNMSNWEEALDLTEKVIKGDPDGEDLGRRKRWRWVALAFEIALDLGLIVPVKRADEKPAAGPAAC